MLHPNCFSHFRPALVLLTFKPAQIDSGYCQAAVVQKPADIFDGFSRIPAKFGGCVPEDMHSRRSDSSLFEVSLEVSVECSAGDAFTMVR